MFTPEQTERIDEVQSILHFPLDRPYQLRSTKMLVWNYTAFQTALTISWLITGRSGEGTAEVAETLTFISGQLSLGKSDEEAPLLAEGDLASLGLRDYETLIASADWLPLESARQMNPSLISEAFSQFATVLHRSWLDDELARKYASSATAQRKPKFGG
ncbi:hypothetical protein CLM74_06430 [Stenotrophomonas sp. MYb57]|uniref:hypothetical protein n=1 Tax=Stenotrophomonas sp. MYb57 TaxID=1827305 RepID=UPI000CF6EA2C|nr:hypothetical protein [Stenotrophomonas sp. MYb57]AVJ32439.1 hypothetical protein CLM74_06430 [Stenotrophomonas sp. MYb57]